MIEIKLSVVDNVAKKLTLLDTKLLGEVDQALTKGAYLIRNTTVKKIQRSKATGRVYVRRGIRHRASAPGESPKSDTGRLASSQRVNSEFLKKEIGSDLKYSSLLEKGTSRMQPRPYLEVSGTENEQKVSELINNAVEKLLNAG